MRGWRVLLSPIIFTPLNKGSSDRMMRIILDANAIAGFRGHSHPQSGPLEDTLDVAATS